MTKRELSERERLHLIDSLYHRVLSYCEPRLRSVEKRIEGVQSMVRQTVPFGDIPMVSQAELAEQLKVNPRTFRRWRNQGLIGGRRVKGRKGLWFTSDEVQEIRELMIRGAIKRSG